MIPAVREVSALETLSTALDAASHEDRVAWMHALPMAQYWDLWELAKGRPVDEDYFLHADGRVRIHEGGNTAPPFRWFQKRFARHSDGSIVGYNHPGGLGRYVVWFQGYGPFIARQSPEVPDEVWVDYTTLPAQHPEFPEVRPIRWTNYLIYGGMIDVMRRVSEDVTIGSTEVKGFPIGLGAKFMLIRQP